MDPSLLDRECASQYAREGWIPMRREQDRVLIGASLPLSPADRARVEGLVGGAIEVVEVPQWRIVHAVMAAFAAEIEHIAAEQLAETSPRRSAKHVLSRGQQVLGIVLLVLIAAGAIAAPAGALTVLIAVASVIFLTSTLFKFVVSMVGSRYDQVRRSTRAEYDALDDDDLPIYTVLVPVFREERVVGRLMRNLGRLDYPQHKLEVLVLTEEEDIATREAIKRAAPPDNFIIVTVPAGTPQTKPRACNVGLQLARGELLVIFDAEDAPEPDQLKRTWLAFDRSSPDTVVMQAALNYFNAAENVLTRMFSLEYSYWFDYMLTGLDERRLPIPLGGTSNHFRTDALRELGGWDPYNVTEDADLGIRASALGYRVGVVDSTTMEEATSRMGIFVGQRSRWIKGYMQTSLVHARHPLQLVRSVGLRRAAAFALLIAGTPLTFLGVIPFTLLMVAGLVVPGVDVSSVMPPIVLWLCLMNFLIGNSLMVYLNMMGPYKRGLFTLVPWALLNPLYWLLHSAAAYKALWQLITRPHYWQKTDHGLSDYDPDQPA
ncbi:MAG: general secretory system II protein E domain-containing protein [Microbacterium sp.]|nr:MAG: general secretory system II protein E domain-containing protein [Microbacterium sp.]